MIYRNAFSSSSRNAIVTILSSVLCLASAGSAGAQSTLVAVAIAKGDPVRGESLYQGCEDCHSIDKNDVGPMHRGVVGRRAGIIPDYDYSPELKASGIVWTEANLDRWLTSPSAFVPGTRMFFQVNEPQDRADLIAYLKTLK